MTRAAKKHAPGTRIDCKLCDWFTEGSDLVDVLLASSKHEAAHASEQR